jgi:hypothetical protein
VNFGEGHTEEENNGYVVFGNEISMDVVGGRLTTPASFSFYSRLLNSTSRYLKTT